MEDGVFPKDEVIKKADEFVCVKAKQDEKESARDHVVSKGWGKDIKYIPAYVFVTPEEEELKDFQKIGAMSAKEFIEHLDKVLKKTGKGLHYSSFTKLNTDLQSAENFVKDGKYKKAIEILKKIADNNKNFGFVDIAKQKLDAINKIGEDKLNEAKKQEESKEYKQAYTIYKFVRDEFKGLPVSDTADKAINNLKDIPE